jgi:serine/threonine protein kinase
VETDRERFTCSLNLSTFSGEPRLRKFRQMVLSLLFAHFTLARGFVWPFSATQLVDLKTGLNHYSSGDLTTALRHFHRLAKQKYPSIWHERCQAEYKQKIAPLFLHPTDFTFSNTDQDAHIVDLTPNTRETTGTSDKLIGKRLTTEPDEVHWRFFQEVASHLTLQTRTSSAWTSHPCLVTFVGVFMRDERHDSYSRYTIVTESASRGDLKSLLRQWRNASRIGSERTRITAMKILVGIALGLKWIHKHGLVHGDLCPHNIFLTEDFEPKIGDLGSSRFHGYSDLPFTGTEIYRPLNEAFGPGFDVYAFGWILWETLILLPWDGAIGLPPTSGGSGMASEAWLEWKKSGPGSLPADADQLPLAVRNLVRDCLKTPDRRPNAAQLFDRVKPQFTWTGYRVLGERATKAEYTEVKEYIAPILAIKKSTKRNQYDL